LISWIKDSGLKTLVAHVSCLSSHRLRPRPLPWLIDESSIESYFLIYSLAGFKIDPNLKVDSLICSLFNMDQAKIVEICHEEKSKMGMKFLYLITVRILSCCENEEKELAIFL